ncbi:MAG: ATPase [Bacteroidota bacterium]
MDKPFVYGKLAGVDYFTNRSVEMKSLAGNFLSGINTILISPRRWGKSSLVWHTALSVQRKHKEIRFCFIDLFNVRTEEEFYEAYARELIKASATKWDERIAGVGKFFKTLIPQLSVPLDPQHDLSLGFEWKQLKKNPDEVIDLAENICRIKKMKLVVCIDEFQNISNFEAPLNFQKKLRAHWQKHNLATYCIYGSKREMMATIFENRSMPFYKFGDVIFLEKIETAHWIPFIVKRFKTTGKSISEELAGKIATLMDNHSYFVQQLAHETWLTAGKKCKPADVDEAVENLLNKLSMLYQRETDQLSNTQLNFLKALSNEETRFSTADVILRYRLGSSANVAKIKSALEQKEIIDTMGPTIQFTDPMYKAWFKKFVTGNYAR